MKFFGRSKARGDEARAGKSGGKGSKAKAGASAAPSRREVLAMRPLRNPALEWEEQDGLIVLHVRRAAGHNWKSRVARLLVSVPEERKVALDAIGTDVWQMLDGQHSIEDIARALARKHKLEKREAELSVQQFFKELGRRGYVGFMGAPGTEEK